MPSKKLISNIFYILIIFIFSYFSFNALLKPGYFPMHDDMQPIRLHQLDKCIKDGQFPCRWTPDLGYGYGYPMFIFYSPFAYYVMEVFHLFGFSLLNSIKIGFILSFVFSAFTMYLLGKSLWGKLGGLVSSAFYIYAPYRAADVYSRGAVGEFWALVFLPLILWSVLNFFKNPKNKFNPIYLSLSTGGLLITHNLSTIAFFPVALIWTLILLFFNQKRTVFINIVYSVSLGFILSAFYTIPLIFERQYVHLDSMISGYFNYLAHFTSLRQLFFRGHWGFGSSELGPYDDLSFSIGTIHWLIVIVSFVLAIKYKLFSKKNKVKIYLVFFGLVFVFSIFLTHSRSALIWKTFSFLKYFQFPWRFLILTILSSSILAGFPIYLIRSKPKLAKIYSFILIFLVVFFNARLFRPANYIQITDQQKLSGRNFELQQTASIFDYLPIYAKAPPGSRAPDQPQVLTGSANFLNLEKGTNWQKGKIIATENSTIQLSSFYYPGFRLMINNNIEKFSYENDLGLITFEVPKGEHEYHLKLTKTLPRIIGDSLSLLAILFLIYYVSI